ncbi:MAG TPA: metal ABC transporter permease [Terriglobales bacterium]|nr:metal ABC transporter permease [Terriglobales bacterium]
MSTTVIESGVMLLAASAAAGLLGSFVVLRRMVLAADALSHVALPGIGLALLLKVNPLAGAVFALLVGTLLIWGVERRARLATETIIGVVFSAALALGSLMTSGEELIHALLGKPTELAAWELALGLAAATGVIVFLVVRRNEILVSIVSRDIARSMGISTAWLDLQFMLAFAVTVAVGVRYLGVLLMGSLVIIPAATAKQVAGNLRTMMLVAVFVAVASTVVGASIGAALGRETGPPIVLVAAAFFLVGLLRTAKR